MLYECNICKIALVSGCVCAWTSYICSGRIGGQGYADRKRIGARDHSSRYEYSALLVLFSRQCVLIASEYRDFSDSELCVSLGVAIPPMDPNESFKMEAQSMKFYREAPSDSEFT
jgi:hypothetical protein